MAAADAAAARKLTITRPCILLIAIAGTERFVFKGVASNMVTFLTQVVRMGNSSAAKVVNYWSGVTFVLPLVVAPLANSYFRHPHHSTIFASALVYLLGLVVLASTTLMGAAGIKTTSASLFFISLGNAGYKPALQALAAEQLEDDSGGEEDKSAFFKWSYFGVCCGSLVSFVQETFGWGLGFSIPALSMLASLLLFLSASRFFVHRDPAAAAAGTTEMVVLPSHESSGGDEIEVEGEEERLLDMEKKGMENIYQTGRVVLRLLPVWTMMLPFTVIFQQPATFFIKQGMQMERRVGSHHFRIPPAALQTAITISVIVLTPVYDRAFVPLARRLTKQDKGVTVRQRMGIGMVLSVAAMAAAALTEGKRLAAAAAARREMTIFWLLPQYILLGLSDIFVVVGMQEFFYSGVPATMKTLGFAVDTSVFGVGSFVGSLLIFLLERFTGWLSDDVNKGGSLDKYYWFLSGLSGVSFILFVIFSNLFHHL
ncbi:unnamed protein product [Cuscuta campestris]|uniref:Major facilitator superfamily (MFS) profile domain-containing protein n=1 Tax=Cuscuta campestris TaxID=132261 RepID=A0A484NH72_9ASTE|nr:unnamed protein product [Cuscuta campestris]